MPTRPDVSWGYAIAVLAVALAAAARQGMWGVLGDSLPYLFFFGAITVAAWFGGLRPGLLATILSAIAVIAVSLSAPPSFAFSSLRDVSGLVLFVLVGAGTSALCENLHATRGRMRVTLQSIGDAVIVTDARGRVRSLNPIAVALTGWTEREAKRKPLDDVFRIVDERTRQPVENPALRALRERRIVGLASHTILITKDGQAIPIDDSAAPVRNDAGGIIGCVLVFRDVALRRRAEQSNELLAAIVESSDDAIVSKTIDGTIVTWNTGARRLFGYTAEEALGRPITFIVPESHWEEEAAIIARVARGERVQHFETVRRAKDGRVIEVSITISPIRDADGRIVGASNVTRDITERRRSEEERRDADRRKDEFLATLAHELRNPLAPIRNALHVLRRAGDAPEAGEAALGIMERQLEQMVRLVDDLLDVSRISRGKLELRVERFDLSDAIRRAVESSRPHIEEARQELAVRLPDEPVHVEADLQRLAQAFANLLNNASKFTPEGGRIEFTAERSGDDVVVAVQDTGVGIPPAELRTIFDLFTQLDTSIERPQSGLGLGLTLVRRIVDMHGGTIEAHSEGEGRGSTFVVRLPVTTSAAMTR